jgi:hypothetical protein
MMSKNFSQKDRNRGVALLKTDALPADVQALLAQIAQKPSSELSLPDRFLNWLGRSRKNRAHLTRRASGIEALEPRVLLSGDPLTATWSVAANAALRVSEVQYDADPSANGVDTKSEFRLQLVQGADASGTNVQSELRIRVLDLSLIHISEPTRLM